jgi:ribonuclease G
MPAMSNPTPSNVPPQDVSTRYDQELASAPADQPHEPVNTSALRNEARERSTRRPILQKILNLFQKEKADFRELIINSEPLEKRVALLVDGILEKFEIERESDNRMVGGIFKGRIKNLDPGLKAAFVDIGFNKNAFLHYWDMLPAASTGRKRPARARWNSPSKTSPGSTRPEPKLSSRSPRARSARKAPAPRPTSPCPAAIWC